jgi:hypothetical protein
VNFIFLKRDNLLPPAILCIAVANTDNGPSDIGLLCYGAEEPAGFGFQKQHAPPALRHIFARFAVVVQLFLLKTMKMMQSALMERRIIH